MKTLPPGRAAYAKILEAITKRFVEGKPHLDEARKAVAKLRKGLVVAKTVGSALLQKLARLFPEIATLAKTEVARRLESARFRRLFGEGLEKMRAHPERQKFHRALSQFHDEALPLRTAKRDLDPVTGANLAIDPATFRVAEDTAAVLYHTLAGSIDAYSDLAEETRVFNGIMKALYPDKWLDEFRLDAQHIIEQRAFEQFASTWKKLGWKSKGDLPAIPLHYSFHIRTPKSPAEVVSAMIPEKAGTGVSGIADIAQKKDIVSLTDSLERAIPEKELAKIKTPEEYVRKLIDFYRPSTIGKEKREIGVIGKDIVPVLEQILKELDNLKALEKALKAAGK
jgi:hypothetical protein